MARFFKPQKRKVTDNSHKELHIRRLDHLGSGIAYWQDKPVFVEGALPDETVLVQLIEDKKQYARGRVMKRLSDNVQRVKPKCPLYQQCGGCHLQHLSHEGQVAAKQASLLELMTKFSQVSEFGSDVVAEPVVSAPFGYRRCARLGIMMDKKGGLQIGFRQKNSKVLVDVAHCPVLVDELNDILPSLRTLLTFLKSKKHLGHIELIAADNGPVVLLRHLSPLPKIDLDAIMSFSLQYNIMFYLEPESGQVISINGEMPYYILMDDKFTFSPKDFIQVNANVNTAMVEQALSWLDIQHNDRILDLFCGLGNFSLPLAQKAESVVGVEGIDDMVVRSEMNAKANHRDNVTFYQANLEEDVTQQIWAKAPFNKILLDPARAGASGVMTHILALKPERIVYVSCNPATLARDSKILLDKGYQLARLGMLDMFPQTGHLESMALFMKQ